MSTLYRCPLCGAARLDECICPTAQTRTSGETVSEKTSETLIEELLDASYDYELTLATEPAHRSGDAVRAANKHLTESRAALLSRIRELEADAARLDAIEKGDIVLEAAAIGEGYDIWGPVGDTVGRTVFSWEDFANMRAQIDAARSPESKTEGAKP
jgi:hypothetical protein